MNNESLKYFIYVRKSSEGKDRQALSHEGQLEEIRKIVEREGLFVVDTFRESKSAHFPDNRPLFDEMLRRIRRGEANGIIAWHTNRLSRNPKEAGIIQQMLQDEVIRSIVVPHRHFRSEDNALLFSIESSEANQYSRDLKAAVKRGLYQKCALGHPPNIAPQGYLNTKRVESGSNEIMPDPERWAAIRKAFDLMLTRSHSIAEVADILNREYDFRTRPSRQRSGSPLSTSVLHRVLINPFYTGYFNYSGKQYKGNYKPMITLEEFDTIQEILGRKERPKAHKHEFAFTGLIKCGSCGCAITASKKLKLVKATGIYNEYTFYHCTKRRGKAACADKRYTTETEMREMISSELEKLALKARWKEWAFETIKEDFDDEVSKQEKLLQSTREYEQKLVNELDTLLDLRISGDLSDQQYQYKKAEREALLMRVREKQNRIEGNITNWIEQVKEKLDFAEVAASNFKNGTPELQKSICNAIGWNWVLKSKKLTFTRAEWFTDLLNLKSHFEAEIARLEPVKTFMEYRQTASFQAVRPILSALRDNIRTEAPGRGANPENLTDTIYN